MHAVLADVSQISNMQLALLLIIISSLVSIIYLVWAMFFKREAQSFLSGFTMLLCPLVGPLVFFGAFILKQFKRKQRDLQMEDISFSKERRGRILIPNVEEELQTVPLEEIFIISDDDNRRYHLLRALKKSEIEDFSVLIKALDNDDSETVHYAAATILKAKEEFENNIRELNSFYTKEGGDQDSELVRKYSDYLWKFLTSRILDDLERRKYCYMYVNIMEQYGMDAGRLKEQDYINVVDELLWLGEYIRAEEWTKRALAAEPNEGSHILLAKLYYLTGRTEDLKKLIIRLRESDIQLTNAGLEMVRFFSRMQTV